MKIAPQNHTQASTFDEFTNFETRSHEFSICELSKSIWWIALENVLYKVIFEIHVKAVYMLSTGPSVQSLEITARQITQRV